MAILDYIIIGGTVAAFVIGLIKGFLRPLFNLASTFVVFYAGGAFSALISGWLLNVIPDDGTRSVVAMVASMLLVWLVVFLISRIIIKAISKVKVLGAVNRLLGGVLGLVIVFVVVAVVVAFMRDDAVIFQKLQEKLGHIFEESWIVNNLFKNNPIGEFIVESAFSKLKSVL